MHFRPVLAYCDDVLYRKKSYIYEVILSARNYNGGFMPILFSCIITKYLITSVLIKHKVQFYTEYTA